MFLERPIWVPFGYRLSCQESGVFLGRILHSSNETPASSFNLSDQIVHSDGFQSECDPGVGGMTGCFSKALRPTDCFDKSQSSDTPNVSLPMLPATRVCSSRCCMGSRTCNSGSWKQWVLETASLSVPLKDRTSIVPRVYGLLPPETLEMSFANFTVSPKAVPKQVPAWPWWFVANTYLQRSNQCLGSQN